MRKKIKHLFSILTVSFLLNGCFLRDKIQSFRQTYLLNSTEQSATITEQETVYIFCDEGDIQDYVDKGWEVIETESEIVPCSWKTEKSRPGCNLKDKGCKISVPDKMGEQIKYLLERNTLLDTNNK